MIKRLKKLREVAQMMSDLGLERLAVRAQACERTRVQIAALEANCHAQEGTDPLKAAELRLRHRQWAAPRRMQLNEQLARQTAERLRAEEEARKAFGRAEVLAKLAKDRQV